MVKMIDNYILKDLIGEGTYGKVYKAINTKKQGDYAVKIIPVDKLSQNSKLEQCTFNEIKILSTIGLSKHIVRYYQMLKTKNNFYFVYQFCNGGTLLQKIKRQGYISQNKSMHYFYQLLQAFKILNKFNIMHRDLKAENIFFHNDQVKLGDFGFCKGLQPEQTMTKTMLGSPIYMAPQVLRGQSYSTKADIWSLGVILYQMLYGVCPFQSSSIAMLINTINNTQLNFPITPYVSQQTKSLIKKMLTKDFFRRIGWIQLFGLVLQQNKNEQKKQQQKSILTIYSNDLRNQNHKKSSSIPKNKPDQKIFYSKKYIDIIQSINRRASMDKMDRQKTLQQVKINQPKTQKQIKIYNFSNDKKNLSNNIFSQVSIQPIQKIYGQQNLYKNNNHERDYQFKSAQTISKIRPPTEIQNKRAQLLKMHSECIELLQSNIKLLQKKQKNLLKKCCSIFYKIRNKLNHITSQIKVTQIQLLDVSSLINFQILQIDRQLTQLKQQMNILKVQIPSQNEQIEIKRLIL